MSLVGQESTFENVRVLLALNIVQKLSGIYRKIGAKIFLLGSSTHGSRHEVALKLSRFTEKSNPHEQCKQFKFKKCKHVTCKQRKFEKTFECLKMGPNSEGENGQNCIILGVKMTSQVKNWGKW